MEYIRRETVFDGKENETNKALMKDLKKRGFKFVGPTTIESFLETMNQFQKSNHLCSIS